MHPWHYQLSSCTIGFWKYVLVQLIKELSWTFDFPSVFPQLRGLFYTKNKKTVIEKKLWQILTNKWNCAPLALPAFILHNRFLEICIGLGGVSTPGNLLRRRLLTFPEVLNLNEDYLGIVLKMNGLKCRVTRFARDNYLGHSTENEPGSQKWKLSLFQ